MSSGSDLAEPLLVIDLGHTCSTAALVSGERSQLITDPAGGAACWASAVHFDGQRMLVGALAEEQRLHDPAGYGADFKRGLSVDTVSTLGDRPFRASEQVAAVLSAIRLEAERIQGGPVRRVLMTVPAGYGPEDPRPRRLLEAAEAAGFTEIEQLAEPVAAAHAPAVGPGIAAGDLVLVYDLGGGTFHAALVRVGAISPEIVGHATVDDCGGGDIDRLLSRRVVEAGGHWLDPLVRTATGDTALRLSMAVNEFARQVKHELTDHETYSDHLLPDAPAYRMDRAELAAVAAPVLERTVACCRQLLAAHAVPDTALTTILLVGGASRMPAVVELLAAEFDRPLRRVDEPELTTVRGAVRWLDHRDAWVVPAISAAGRAAPLAFTLPGGVARLLRWLVSPGSAFAAGQVLARVRLPEGALWELAAASDGTVERLLAPSGTDVVTGQWLALTRNTPSAGRPRTAPGDDVPPEPAHGASRAPD